MAFIEVIQLSKQYKDKQALDEVSFTLEKGEILVITGDNGAGKSTLLNVLSTLIMPTKGQVLFDGLDIIRKPQEARSVMSYIPQEIALHMQLTLRDNLNFWAGINGLSKKERTVVSEHLISLLDLEPYLKTKICKLSGGLKRRTNIAAGLFNEPKIILMDEVTAGVDSESRKKILDFVLTEKSKGTAIIFVTHMTDEIRYLNDKILRLDKGRLEFFGKVSEMQNVYDICLL